MSPDDLADVLGFPNLTPALRPPRLQRSRWAPPTSLDRDRARGLLANLRTADPLYKPPDESKKRLLRSQRKNKALADTSQWTFSPYEIAMGVAKYFADETLMPAGVLRALLDMAAKQEGGQKEDGHSVNSIWKRSRGPPPARGLMSLRKPKDGSFEAGPCQWVALAAGKSAKDVLACLLEAGVSQNDGDVALESALERKDYAIARELLAFDAAFPDRPDLFSAATGSHGLDMDFVNLWLAAPVSPPRELATPARAATTQTSSPQSRKALSMLLTAYPPSAAETVALLSQAIELVNLETLATIITAAAIDSNWSGLEDIEQSESCVRGAARIQDADARYRVLSFLFAAGVEPNRPTLRSLLLQEVKKEHVRHIELLVSHGVPSHVQDGLPALSPLEAAVETSRTDILRLVVPNGTRLPSGAASAAAERISDGLPEHTQAEMLDLLGPHIRKPKRSLSRLLLRAVQHSKHVVINTLLRHGARSDYVDAGGANSLDLAVKLGDVSLIQSLCAATPTAAIASQVFPVAYRKFGSGPSEPMFTVLSLLIREGASGGPVELVFLRSAAHADYPRILRLLLPLGIASEVRGEALLKAMHREDIASLQVLCGHDSIPERAVTEALNETLYRAHDRERAKTVVAAASRWNYKHLLSNALAHSELERHPECIEIINLLASHGAKVNVGDKLVLAVCVVRGRTDMVKRLLEKDPDTTTLSKALKAALAVESRDTRMVLCKLIVRKSTSNLGEGSALPALINEPCPDLDLINVLLSKSQSLASLTSALETALEVERRQTRRALCKLIVRASSKSSVNGDMLAAVFQEGDLDWELARLLLSKPPPADELSGVLKAGLALQTREARRKICELIVAASTSSIGEGDAFLHVVRETDADPDLVRILLRKSPSSATLSIGLEVVLAVHSGDTRRTLCKLVFDASKSGEVGERQGLSVLVEESVLDQKLICSFLHRINTDMAARSATLKAALRRRSRADRMALCELALGGATSGIGKSDALVTLVEELDLDMKLINFLINKGASVNHGQGQALVKAIERQNIGLVKTLLGDIKVEPATLSRCFGAAMALPRVPPRTELAALLLSSGVSLDDRAAHLKTAVKSRDLPLLQLLLAGGGTVWLLAADALSYAVTQGYVPAVALMVRQEIPEPMLVSVFQSLVRTGNLGAPQYIETAALLMSLGLPLDILTSALLEACSETASVLHVEFISLLVKHGANPMVEDARCIIAAAKKNHVSCVERLLEAPSFDLDAAVRALVGSIDDEETLVGWVDICLKQSGGAGFQEHSLLLLAVERFPSGAVILRQLLNNGCVPKLALRRDRNETTFLMSILANNGRASDEVVLNLLDHPLAAPSFVQPADGLSAMHLAAGAGRLPVLRKLMTLEGEFSIQVPDSAGFTPLCHATKSGHVEAMTALIEAGSKLDNGSLHIAARNLDIPSIKLLRRHGHDILYPHPDLGGRRPIEELILSANGFGRSWEVRLEAAIRELLPLPDPRSRPMHEKSLLHIAVDHRTSALAVLGVLLRVSQLWRNPGRDDDYLYANPTDGYLYSLTKYVDLLCPSEPVDQKQSLITLLKANKFVDRFYADNGPQPPGAVGLPQHLEDAVKEQKQAEWKLQQELRRREEAAAQQARLTDQLHRQNLARMEASKAQELKEARERFELEQAQEQKRLALQQQHEQARLALLEQHEETRLEQERARIEQEKSALAARRDHQASVDAAELASQAQQAQQAEALEAARLALLEQHEEKRLEQERARIEQEKSALAARRDHQARVAAAELASQAQQAQQAEALELARVAKVQALQAQQNQQELAHYKEMERQRFATENNAEQLRHQAQERRMERELQHQGAVSAQKLLVENEADARLEKRLMLEARYRTEMAQTQLDLAKATAALMLGGGQPRALLEYKSDQRVD